MLKMTQGFTVELKTNNVDFTKFYNYISTLATLLYYWSWSKMHCSAILQMTSSFVWASSSFIHCLVVLDFRPGVEQPFVCLIIQNRQAMQSMGRSMDWTLKDNMVDSLFFCATLTGRRGGHSPFVQAGVEMSDTSVEAVKSDPGSSWEIILGVCVPVSGIKVRSLVGLSAHSTFHWWSAHCAAHILLSEKLMSCCATVTNGCLDMRRCATALDGRVSAEWSRCPSSMPRRSRDSVATLRWSSAGWTPVRIGRLSTGVGRSQPVTIRKASLMVGSMRRAWALRHQRGAQYSAVKWTRARVAIHRASKLPQECDAWC